jgi:hypothetical protein
VEEMRVFTFFFSRLLHHQTSFPLIRVLSFIDEGKAEAKDRLPVVKERNNNKESSHPSAD